MSAACPTDDELLALATDEAVSPAVREHVRHCERCRMREKLLRGEVLELRSLSRSAAAEPPKTVVPNIADALPRSAATIGRYAIVGEIGSGGQADVYRVIDPELGRSLVLKLSRRKFSDVSGRRDALLAEGRLLAELDHPGLVRIFDVGVHDGRPYLVLEHVAGRNLAQSFADKRPSPQEAARLTAEIARTLTYAHERGVVHGDVTPRNILIDSEGRARLIDFGLSKIENAWSEDDHLPGGTPEFMPPESAGNGSAAGRVGPASDVFGLGATLYWLLAGQAPFTAPTLIETLARARRCDIDFAALQRAGVPGRLARICRQALAAEPASRPSSSAMAGVLERASGSWFAPRVAVAMVAAVLVGLGFLLWRKGRSEPDSVEGGNVVHSVPEISVLGSDGPRKLSNVLPLRTGDRIAVVCRVSQGQRATILWFHSGGKVELLEPARDVARQVDHLTYPTPHQWVALPPPAGTEMIFFCRGVPAGDDLEAWFPNGVSVPALPEQNWLRLIRSEVDIEGPLKSGVTDEVVAVEAVMKTIDRDLRRHFDGVTGIAFPHYPAARSAE
jgi:tRNA A-37 threonylcarbamoyl transferase component Bud32